MVSPTPPALRQRVAALRRDGKSFGQIAKSLKMARSTVGKLCKHFAVTGKLLPSKRSPQSFEKRRAFSKHQLLVMKRVQLSNRQLSSRLLAGRLSRSFGRNVAASSVRRWLLRMGLRSYKCPKGVVLNKKHRQERLAFARKHRHRINYTKWIFADEKYWKRYADGIRPRERLLPSEMRADKISRRPTAVSGGYAAMSLAAIGVQGASPLHFFESNQHVEQDSFALAVDTVLAPWLQELADDWPLDERLAEPFTLYLDNSPVHRTKVTREVFKKHRLLFRVLPTPACSPDCNPIEAIWGLVDGRVNRSGVQNVQQLKAVVLDEWSKLSLADVNKQMDTMPDRLKNVIRKRGWHTKY